MLYLCEYTWQPHTTREKIAERFQQLHESGMHHQDKWRGWYQLVGGGAGFLLVETEDPREVTEMLQPYMDLVSWDVRAIYELKYDEMLQSMRQAAGAGTRGNGNR
jgi:hypothetical protein